MIKRLFIANRGEIAARIARSAVSLGVTPVVCSDRASLPAYLKRWGVVGVCVERADLNLFLDGPRLIALATAAGCDGLHPGYGFLSEDSHFASKVQAAGLIWVGPPPAAMAAMGDKAQARQVAQALGIPCPKGLSPYTHSPAGAEGLEAFLTTVSFPLLIKAAKGGGGKGMRLVHTRAELAAACERARSQAQQAFGDGSLLLEQAIAKGRHVEVQVLADEHGHILTYGDRDCSVQRRYQKVIEEAPATHLHPETRAQLHAHARELAKAVGYRSLGTVEYMVAATDPRAPQAYFFLEMNPRLQVEHTVTEEAFGVDLVAWQLRIACGEALTQKQPALKPRQHSIEARLYLEDPEQGFLPIQGAINGLLPCYEGGLRWELGVDPIDTIEPDADPLVAKVIATAPSRQQALGKLHHGLSQTGLFAKASNRELLAMLVAPTGALSQGPVQTNFLEDHLPELLTARWKHRENLHQKAWALKAPLRQALSQRLPITKPSIATITQAGFAKVSSSLHGLEQTRLLQHTTILEYTTKSQANATYLYGEGCHTDEKNAQSTFFFAACFTASADHWYIQWQGFCFEQGSPQGLITREPSLTAVETQHAEPASTTIKAPVPGTVLQVGCAAGDLVSKDQVLFVLESMKMEFELKASRTGRLQAVGVLAAERVQAGQILASF